MNHRQLGDSDLEVSEISLGSWLTYSGRGRARPDRGLHARGLRGRDQLLRHRQRLRHRRRRGSMGRDPLRLRPRLLHARDEGLLSDVGERPVVSRPSRSQSRSMPRCARLRTDYVDLYQCHRFDIETPIEETMEALTAVVESGKARYIGFSEWTPEQIQAGLGGRRGQVRFLSAAVQRDLARAGGRGFRALRRQRDLADRLVATGPGRADRQVRAGQRATGGLARSERGDERRDRALHERGGARGGQRD